MSGAAADLLLIRLLPAGKTAAKAKDVRAALDRYVTPATTEDGFAELIALARAAGYVEAKALRLTELGRAKAAEALGLSEPPEKVTWAYIEKTLLPSVAGAKGSPGELAARLLGEHYSLGLPSSATMAQVTVAIMAKMLGVPGETDLQRLKRRVLSREAGFEEELDAKRLNALLPRKVLGLSGGGKGEVQARIVRGWLANRPAAKSSPPADDPRAFAARMLELARAALTGHFGPNKIFISHLWRHASGERGGGMSLDEFKRLLVGANDAGLVELNRADMTQGMDADDVKESMTAAGPATFHFLVFSRESS